MALLGIECRGGKNNPTVKRQPHQSVDFGHHFGNNRPETRPPEPPKNQARGTSNNQSNSNQPKKPN